MIFLIKKNMLFMPHYKALKVVALTHSLIIWHYLSLSNIGMTIY